MRSTPILTKINKSSYVLTNHPTNPQSVKVNEPCLDAELVKEQCFKEVMVAGLAEYHWDSMHRGGDVNQLSMH